MRAPTSDESATKGVAPRAVLYLRQSTFREESISLELQETAGRDYCARMGYVVTAVEADPGISGRTWKRPAVQRVMEMVETGAADAIVLWRWSRLSRNRKDWAVAADRVDVAGGTIESATEPNDVTAAGRFARGVMTELAAFESERIGENWKEVQDRRRKNGLPGGGKVPYGWMYQDGKVVPHPTNGAAIPAMYELYLGGTGARQIGKWLTEHGYLTYNGRVEWNHSSITQTLDSGFHAGYVIHRGELLPGAHEGLISPETWRRYLAVRRSRAKERAVKQRYLLSGILRCASCGGPMYGFTIGAKHGHRSSQPYHGYRCKGVADPNHGPGTMSSRIIDKLVIEWLQRVANDVEPFAPSPAPSDAKLDAQRLAREVAAIDAQVVTLTEQLGAGIVPQRAYRVTVDSLEEKRAVLAAALRRAEDEIIMVPDDPRGIARNLVDTWDTTTLTAKRQALRDLLIMVKVDCRAPRRVTITPRGMDPVANTV